MDNIFGKIFVIDNIFGKIFVIDNIFLQKNLLSIVFYDAIMRIYLLSFDIVIGILVIGTFLLKKACYRQHFLNTFFYNDICVIWKFVIDGMFLHKMLVIACFSTSITCYRYIFSVYNYCSVPEVWESFLYDIEKKMQN